MRDEAEKRRLDRQTPYLSLLPEMDEGMHIGYQEKAGIQCDGNQKPREWLENFARFLKTPGREESEIKLYSKADYKAARGQTTAPAAASQQLGQAAGFLQALGGAANIDSINNCATRLRIALVDMAKTQSDDVFKALGAHGVVRRGNGIQVIVGLHVPQVRDQLESLMKTSLTNEQTTLTEAIS